MPELYLRLLDRVLTPVLLILAVILLLAGHNHPGGGFIAGLVVAAAFQLQILSRGERYVRNLIGPRLQPLIGTGLLLAVLAAWLGVWQGGFFEGVWWEGHVGPLPLELGSPMLFDLGVFCVVLAVVTSYLLGLSQSDEATSGQAAKMRVEKRGQQ